MEKTHSESVVQDSGTNIQRSLSPYLVFYKVDILLCTYRFKTSKSYIESKSFDYKKECC